MFINRSTKIMLSGAVFLYLMAGLFSYLDNHVESIPFRLSAISYLAHCVLCILGLIYLSRDIPNNQSRRYLMAAMIFLLAWQIVDMVKEVLFPEDFTVNRILWYLFYVPMLFIPATLFIASLHSRLHNSQRPKTYGNLVLLVSAILSLAVLTNDYHQKAFKFEEGPASFYRSVVYGPVFYASMIWIFALFVLAGYVLWKRIKVERTRKYIWVLVIIIGFAGLYLLWRVTNFAVFPELNDIYNVPQIWEGVVLLAMELSVRTGIIRANYNFLEFFTASTISSSLVDADGTVRYQTSGIIPTTRDQRLKALEEVVYLDRDHRLSGRYISGGYAFWTDDLSEFNELNEQLSETQERLKEENNLIKAENEILSRRAKADERNKLYNLMAKSVSSELDIIEDLITSTTPDSPDFREKLSEACIYKAYIKRYCNMMLLAQDSEELSSFELENSIRESLEYIKLKGIRCELVRFGDGFYPAPSLLLAYRIYERAIIKVGQPERIQVELAANETGLRLSIRMDGKDVSLTEEDFYDLDQELIQIGASRYLTMNQNSKLLQINIPRWSITTEGARIGGAA